MVFPVYEYICITLYSYTTVCACSLETYLSIRNSQTEHDMEMKIISIDFPHQVMKVLEAHGCKPWVTNLSIIAHYTRYANHNYYSLYNIS